MSATDCRVLTVGHSTRSIDAFIELLVAHGVSLLIDVRTVPRSRHNPQFGIDTLPLSLANAGIGFTHVPASAGFAAPRQIRATRVGVTLRFAAMPTTCRPSTSKRI